MSAAFGPGDRLRCIRSDQNKYFPGVGIAAGELYTVARLHPVWDCWPCDLCGDNVTDGIVLMEPSATGDCGCSWCGCCFKPTWEDDQTSLAIYQTAEAVTRPPGQCPLPRIPATKEPA